MIRHFEASDLDACVDLYVATFSRPPWCETWEPRIVHARLDQIARTPGAFGAVIPADGGIAGFVLGISEPWHEGSHFYLKEMCVAPERQRQGLGTRLMEYLFDELRGLDAKRVYLVTARGDISEAFYTKAGFYTSPKMILMARRIE